MFVQVIQGKVSDPAGLRERLDVWVRDLEDGATGWLGMTGGVADDGTFVQVVRFESQEAARKNSERPEQGEWWEGTKHLFSGDVAFHDCTDVETVLGGGSDDAGFVQVIQGSSSDLGRLREVGRRMSEISSERPEIIGGLVAFHPDGRGFTQTAYFTSEAEAREGESKELSGEAKELRDEYLGLVENPTFIDLRDPWLVGP